MASEPSGAVAAGPAQQLPLGPSPAAQGHMQQVQRSLRELNEPEQQDPTSSASAEAGQGVQELTAAALADVEEAGSGSSDEEEEQEDEGIQASSQLTPFARANKRLRRKVLTFAKRFDDLCAEITADYSQLKDHPRVRWGGEPIGHFSLTLPVMGKRPFLTLKSGIMDSHDAEAILPLVNNVVCAMDAAADKAQNMQQFETNLTSVGAPTTAAGSASRGQRRAGSSRGRDSAAAAAAASGAPTSMGSADGHSAGRHALASTSSAAAAAPSRGSANVGWRERGISSMAVLPPSKLKQQTARSILTVLRANSQFPSASAAGLCAGGQLPGKEDMRVWFVRQTATGQGGFGSSTGSGAEGGSCRDGGGHSSSTGSTSGACGCGGNCSQAREQLGWPAKLPLVDYQQVSASVAEHEAIIGWAESQLVLRGEQWCKGNMATLLAKHQQAVEQHTVQAAAKTRAKQADRTAAALAALQSSQSNEPTITTGVPTTAAAGPPAVLTGGTGPGHAATTHDMEEPSAATAATAGTAPVASNTCGGSAGGAAAAAAAAATSAVPTEAGAELPGAEEGGLAASAAAAASAPARPAARRARSAASRQQTEQVKLSVMEALSLIRPQQVVQQEAAARAEARSYADGALLLLDEAVPRQPRTPKPAAKRVGWADLAGQPLLQPTPPGQRAAAASNRAVPAGSSSPPAPSLARQKRRQPAAAAAEGAGGKRRELAQHAPPAVARRTGQAAAGSRANRPPRVAAGATATPAAGAAATACLSNGLLVASSSRILRPRNTAASTAALTAAAVGLLGGGVVASSSSISRIMLRPQQQLEALGAIDEQPPDIATDLDAEPSRTQAGYRDLWTYGSEAEEDFADTGARLPPPPPAPITENEEQISRALATAEIAKQQQQQELEAQRARDQELGLARPRVTEQAPSFRGMMAAVRASVKPLGNYCPNIPYLFQTLSGPCAQQQDQEGT